MNCTAYHFTADTLRDGTPIPPIGHTLIHHGPLKMCRSGFHASRYVWQAVEYAPGHILHRVECGGEMVEDDDKLVCRKRTILATIDATDLLRDYARSCARDVLHLWDAPDVVQEYLETGNEELRTAARAAAWAAWGAAEDAAEAAAWDAAWDAALAAWAAAEDAARAARASARASARDAARDAMRRKHRARLTRMVNEAFAKGTTP